MQVANARLEFIINGSGSDAGLVGLTFAVRELASAQHLLQRRGLRVYLAGSDREEAGHLHIATDSTHGVPISLVQRTRGTPASVSERDDAVSGLDHVVIRTCDPERAVALYAGRLGLSLRLDRSEPSWGARLLFFRCGDLIIELAHDLKAGVGEAPDKLWGLSWRVPDIAAAHARLRNGGIDVSEIRSGRRAGSKVFSVRSHNAGVPTLMIGPDNRSAA